MKSTQLNEIKKIGIGLSVIALFYTIIILDAETGWLGGGPGDANIGLGLVGLFVIPIGIGFIVVGLFNFLKTKFRS